MAHPNAKPPARVSATHTPNDFNTLPPASVILLPTPPNRAILSRFVRRGRIARSGRGRSDELDELDGVLSADRLKSVSPAGSDWCAGPGRW